MKREFGKLALCVLSGVLLAAWSGHSARAAMSDRVIRIGVLTDESGNSADVTGKGSISAARMAVEKMGGSINGVPIEIIDADSQNKPDVGAGIAQRGSSRKTST